MDMIGLAGFEEKIFVKFKLIPNDEYVLNTLGHRNLTKGISSQLPERFDVEYSCLNGISRAKNR